MRSPEEQETGRRMARIMVVSGLVTILIAIVLGALVWTPLYAVAALALIDFGLASAFSSGKLQARARVERG